MPMHIDNLTSRVHVSTGELPFTDEQLNRLVDLVCARLAAQKRESAQSAEATRLYRTVAPPNPVED